MELEKIINNKVFNTEIQKLTKNGKIVFCDIDGTIYRNSLFLDVIDNLIQDGYVSQSKIKKYNEYKQAWKNRQINYEEFLMYSVVEIFEKLIQSKKVHSDLFKQYAKTIIKNNGRQILIYTINKLKELQNNGYQIVFISGSPIDMVKEFAKLYGFNVGLGSYLEKDDDGFYNGTRIVLASSENKLALMNYIISEYTPIHTISFGDTNGDYTMITNTDIGVAVNPTNELYMKIRELDNIFVIIERKDLIIELDKIARKYVAVI